MLLDACVYTVYSIPSTPLAREVQCKQIPMRAVRPNKVLAENAKKKPKLLTDCCEMDCQGKHYKKKLLQQHVRPPEDGGGIAASPFSVSTAQTIAMSGKDGQCDAECAMQARKRRTSRSQYRHKDIEVYKLGATSSK